ncbi:MAG: hypothetical protein KF757_00560 [Phycisphaeraceae bacterium]|nr:hypothetical protein [Phycisphaeraceae bacterium]MCW5761699.1 hypothetical protein [Phycisphaeraceae bacterium]
MHKKMHKSGKRQWTRKGVASVLAMMFLIIFGSLVAAMAIASTGNIRTAAMHLHVMRAMSAAETGLAVAEGRLLGASRRFVVSQSDIDSAFTWGLWTGNGAAIGDHSVLPPASGYSEVNPPAGLAEALVNHHNSDLNIISGGSFIASALIGSAPAGVDNNEYLATHWVYTPAVAIEAPLSEGSLPPAFQIRYAPLADGQHIRVIVDGFDFDYRRNNEPIRRTVSRDYRLVKRVNHAIISPNKIMIGKNVRVVGDLGARFDDIEFEMGDPLIIRSDFFGLDPVLDQKLTDFFAGVDAYDVDGDNRLRVGHPIESQGIPSNETDYSQNGEADYAFVDVTEDGFVDEFDIFIRHFDADGDKRVTLSAALIAGTPAEAAGATPEFTLDDDLALLLDGGNPDRNRNGVFGYEDVNDNGRYDPGVDILLDFDSRTNTYRDLELGYRDGYIDAMDQYAKVNGRVVFRVNANEWVAERGAYGPKLRGPVRPEDNQSPLIFDAPDAMLPEINVDSFSDTENALMAAASGDAFWTQVAAQLGTDVASLTLWQTANNPGGPNSPHFTAVWPDANLDGIPDNAADAYFEKSPFNSPNYADWYYRPVFRRFRFRNVVIPLGLNALFVDCEFIGSTLVETSIENTHPHWTLFGQMVMNETLGYPVPAFERVTYGPNAGDNPANVIGAPYLPDTARPPQQVLEKAVSPMDKGDVLVPDIINYTNDAYAALPNPLVIGGKRVTDTKKFSNNIRFHDCLIVGSVVGRTPVNYTQVRNKLQFTGATRFSLSHPDFPQSGLHNPDPEDVRELAKSSMMLPNYSVDIGTFNSPPEQDVRLTGAIIAGVLDIRGNASIKGALLLTFKPVHGEGPLVDVAGNPIGNPAGFNASIGYFGPEDGDYESMDPESLPLHNGVRIVGWDLNGDGLADLGPTETPTQAQLNAGAVPVPFHGYGRIELSYDPDMTLPSGLRLPLQVAPRAGSYQEGNR